MRKSFSSRAKARQGLNWTHADKLNRALLEFLGKGN